MIRFEFDLRDAMTVEIKGVNELTGYTVMFIHSITKENVF